MALKLTLGTGEVLEIPFSPTSALTVTSVTVVDGIQVETAQAHSDVVGIELVDDPPVESPAPVTMTPEEAAANAPATITEPPAVEDQSLLGKVEDVLHIGSHDDAVTAAQTAVDAAASGAPADHVAAAIADVDAALAAYPDSAQLQDAKAQLELIAGTNAPAAGE